MSTEPIALPVIVHHSAEPMSHSKDGGILELCPYCVLDEGVCLQIDSGCGFVKD